MVQHFFSTASVVISANGEMGCSMLDHLHLLTGASLFPLRIRGQGVPYHLGIFKLWPDDASIGSCFGYLIFNSKISSYQDWCISCFSGGVVNMFVPFSKSNPQIFTCINPIWLMMIKYIIIMDGSFGG